MVLIAALQNSGDRIRGIEAGADDFISKPFNARELRARVPSLIRTKRYPDDHGIVHVFDAMTTARPYKRAPPAESVYGELSHEADVGWRRRDLVDEFIRVGRSGGLRCDEPDRGVGADALPAGEPPGASGWGADKGVT